MLVYSLYVNVIDDYGNVLELQLFYVWKL